MADSRRKDRSWSDPSDKGKQGYRQLRRDALSNVFTILLTAVIIVGGIMLPSLVYPYIDSYEGLTRLEAPDSVVSGHVFEQPVALYPWNIYNEATKEKKKESFANLEGKIKIS